MVHKNKRDRHHHGPFRAISLTLLVGLTLLVALGCTRKNSQLGEAPAESREIQGGYEDEITEVGLTLFPEKGTKRYLKFTLIRNGTVIKRDLGEIRVYQGVISRQEFSQVTRAIVASDFFGKSPAEPNRPAIEVSAVRSDDRKRIKLTKKPNARMKFLIKRLLATVNQVKWEEL